jgi:putative transposase
MQHILKALPRGAFDRIVNSHQADKHSKGFGCWDQLVAMIYAQLSGASSLRVLETGFNSQGTHHYHLGTAPIRRSTLADSNVKRKVEVFAETAQLLMSQAKRSLRRECEELLYLLDSTSITLKGRGFDTWTSGNGTRNTQGIKLHILYTGNEEVPIHHSFTAPNINDIDEGVKLKIESGAVYVFDKGSLHCPYLLKTPMPYSKMKSCVLPTCIHEAGAKTIIRNLCDASPSHVPGMIHWYWLPMT